LTDETTPPDGTTTVAREVPDATPDGPDILVVDDDPRNLAAIEVALGDLAHHLVKAESGPDALRRLLEKDFALILLDVQMPGMDGFETARIIRQRKRSRHTPIIFVTAYSRDDTDILRGYSLGAVDFLFKPIVPEVLRAKASVFVELQQRTAEVRRQAERLRQLERQELERELAAERQTWEADLLRQESRRKDHFLAVLAHELRNPLAPIVTGLELVRQYGIEHEGLERVRESMGRQVRHLMHLVDDLLDVARISQGKVGLRKEAVELGEVVSQAVETVRGLLDERRHELEIAAPDRPLSLAADSVRLTQVVANLLNNAARHTDPGGRIRVSWTCDGGEAVLRVADNGHGIAPEVRDRIFEMFYQEQEGGMGLGLGLTLVDQLVTLHGGTVRAYSAGRGKGSEFVVRLPVEEPLPHPGSEPAGAETARDESQGAADEPSAHHHALTVVVVDDERDIRQALSDLLASWGHEVRVAEDGRTGVDLILELRPDVALVDLAMPGLDGFSVARQVREELGSGAPRLVAVTGFGREEDRRRTHHAGFDDHLVKPATPVDLRRVLRR
jgi:two-component system, sensor histidine kinase